MPRIATMIASATEIVCALGFEDALVARSHECDFPPSVTRLPVCTAPRFEVVGSSIEIDRRVKSLLEKAMSIYHVDPDMLQATRPEVIITQSQCEVCAVSEKDVETALARMIPASDAAAGPKIVSLSPNNLAEVWQSIRNVAGALEVPTRGETLVRQLQARVEAIASSSLSLQAPTVACLEWIEPLMAAGNWVPELVEQAGGRNLFGEAGKHSPWMTWEQLSAADPMIIVVMPCGFDLTRTIEESATLERLPNWNDLQAVRSRRVFAVDGNQFFNRPGPRLVESLEILAEIFHPEVFQFGHKGNSWRRL